MSDGRRIITTGFVVFAEQGPGDASLFYYTVDINWPDGSVRRIEHVKPAGPAWPSDVVMEPAAPDTPFLATIVGEQVLCWIRCFEFPSTTECE